MERLHRHRTCQAQHILGEPFTVCTVMRSVYCVYIDYVSQSISMQLIDCFYCGLYIVSSQLIVKFYCVLHTVGIPIQTETRKIKLLLFDSSMLS